MQNALTIWLRLLATPKRDAVRAVIEGCAEIRSTILAHAATTSSCCSNADRIVELIRDRIDSIYDGRTPPAGWPLVSAVRDHEIPSQLLHDYVAGCEREARTARYAIWPASRRHCESVGGNVAAMVACVLGLTHSDARAQAIDLGAAARLVTILQSLKADLTSGRIYLPLEDLAKCRCSERELLGGAITQPIRDVVRLQVDRARELLGSAAGGVGWVAGDGSRLAVAVAIEWHRAALEDIERRGFDVLTRAPLPPPSLARVLRRLPRAWRLAQVSPTQPASLTTQP